MSTYVSLIPNRVEAVGVSGLLMFKVDFPFPFAFKSSTEISNFKAKSSGDLPNSLPICTALCWTWHGYLTTRPRQNAGRVSTPETCQEIK